MEADGILGSKEAPGTRGSRGDSRLAGQYAHELRSSSCSRGSCPLRCVLLCRQRCCTKQTAKPPFVDAALVFYAVRLSAFAVNGICWRWWSCVLASLRS